MAYKITGGGGCQKGSVQVYTLFWLFRRKLLTLLVYSWWAGLHMSFAPFLQYVPGVGWGKIGLRAGGGGAFEPLFDPLCDIPSDCCIFTGPG